MIIKTYQIYLSKIFATTLLKTFIVFLSLAFILNIFEEINFFKDLKVSIAIPVFLTLLNIPSILFDIFPFEIKANENFSVEIEALTLVMEQYKSDSESNVDFDSNNKKQFDKGP